MAKKQISALDLATKYLTKLGVQKTVLNTALLPSKYEDVFMCVPQRKSNVVAVNKRTLSGNQTHIAVSKAAWEVFFTPAQTTAFATTKATCETNQTFNFFEANLHDMLDRRSKKISSIVVAATAIGTYSAGTSTILSDTGRKWIGEQNGETQVHLGRINGDSNTFKDFRLGILIDDYLLFFKEKHTDKVLAVSVPQEYARRFKISNVKAFKPSPAAVSKQRTATTTADALYVASATSSSVAPAYSPNTPQAAPPPSPGRSGKPRYKADPALGKGALAKAGYVCENCGKGTFTARSTGCDFMEPHHLIPISCQGNYTNKIDITDNLICLCPNCHSQIHYGINADREVMIRKFLAARKTDLKNHGGIDIDENTLLGYYKI